MKCLFNAKKSNSFLFKLSSYKRILAKKIACLEWIKTSWSYFLKLCIQSYSVTYCAVIETKNKEIPLFFNWIPVVFFGTTFKAKESYHSTPTCHISSQKWNTLFEIYYLLHEYLELLDDYLATSQIFISPENFKKIEYISSIHKDQIQIEYPPSSGFWSDESVH